MKEWTRPLMRALLIFAPLNLLLLALEIPRHSGFGPNWIAFEALLLAGLFMLLPAGSSARRLAWLAGGLFGLLTLLALADALALMSLSRRVNVYLDYPLARSVYHLAVGNLSPVQALLAGTGILAFLLAVTALVRWLLCRLPGRPTVPRRVLAAALLLAGAGGIASFHAGPALPNLPRAITPGITLVKDQVRFGRAAHFERQAFEALLERDTRTTPVALPRLAGVDVILGFIESYGVSAIHDPRYAPIVGPRLDRLAAEVERAGLHMVSGLLNAPMFGGQSWLAHSSLLSGLWISNQMRYEFLLGTPRSTLVDDFALTGHRTVAVMPAITLPWPEGRWYGFDDIREAADLPYAGPPFNWVTMPDQFTWAFFEQRIRRADPRPVFAKLALISSHAPWVPILPVLEDWDAVGDGSVYRQWEGIGESPESLWRDPERVREHYALSVAYAIEVAGAYAARYTDDSTLLIVLGDHQPAALITGAGASPAVPVHMISGDPALLQPFIERGFVEGAWPDADRTDTGMDQFRHWLHADFGER